MCTESWILLTAHAQWTAKTTVLLVEGVRKTKGSKADDYDYHCGPALPGLSAVLRLFWDAILLRMAAQVSMLAMATVNLFAIEKGESLPG